MQINRFPKKFRGRRQILVGVLVRRKIRNQSDHGGFTLHYAALSAALSAKTFYRSENSMITYATGAGRGVVARWHSRLRYAQQPV